MKNLKRGKAMFYFWAITFVLYNTYYGWNYLPESRTEEILDSISIGLFIVAIIFYAILPFFQAWEAFVGSMREEEKEAGIKAAKTTDELRETMSKMGYSSELSPAFSSDNPNARTFGAKEIEHLVRKCRVCRKPLSSPGLNQEMYEGAHYDCLNPVKEGKKTTLCTVCLKPIDTLGQERFFRKHNNCK